MGLNTTGQPNTGDYVLGRGIVYLASLASNDKPDAGGWRDVGNATEFTVTVESETLEHTSSRAGLQVVDKEVILSQSMSLSFTLDEINFQNLALFLSGETASHTNAAVAGWSDVELSDSVVLGRWYDLVNASGERAYDIKSANLTVVEAGTPTNLVLGTDYLLDAVMGRIFILSTATNIDAGETLECTYTADATAKTVDEVRGLTQGNVLAAVKFIGENPANQNRKREFHFHKVTLSSDGDFALIGDEYSTMAFNGSVEDATSVDPDAPFVRIRDVAA
jgi:hypothetical protein